MNNDASPVELLLQQTSVKQQENKIPQPAHAQNITGIIIYLKGLPFALHSAKSQ